MMQKRMTDADKIYEICVLYAIYVPIFIADCAQDSRGTVAKITSFRRRYYCR